MGRHNDQSSSGSSTPGSNERERELSAAHRQHQIGTYRSLVLHWMGRWMRRSRRANITPLPSVVPGQVGISFSGHATVLLRYNDLNIVCDPMLGKWVKGVKRAVMPGLTPADLHDVDVILISHAHMDHLHRPTLAALPRSATVIVPPRTAQYVSEFGFARVVELAPDQSIQDRGVDIVSTGVQHGSDEHPALSYVIRGDGPSVFFCGDSGYFSGFADIGKRFAPDIALLPIGGYAPLSFRDRHMSPLDALYALEDLGSRIMIPIHHGAFALSYERLDEPISWLEELVEERGLHDFVVPLEPGESRVFVPPRAHSAQDPHFSSNTSTSTTQNSGSGSVAIAAATAADEAAGGFSLDFDLVHALPAMRAAHVASNTPWTDEPLWALGGADALPLTETASAQPAGLPAFARIHQEHDPAPSVPTADGDALGVEFSGPSVGLEDMISAPVSTADSLAFAMNLDMDLHIDREGDELLDRTDPLLAVPELVIEPVSAVHSDPIELRAKSADAPELADLVQMAAATMPPVPVAPEYVLSESPVDDLLFPEDAFDDIEQLVDSSLFAAESREPEPAFALGLIPPDDDGVADEAGDAPFDMTALLAAHFDQNPHSRLRERIADDFQRRIERDRDTGRSAGHDSRAHHLEPMAALI